MSDAEDKTTDSAAKEIGREERQRHQQLKADAEVFQSLVKHPGWPRYMVMLEMIGNNFNKQLMAPLENSFQAVKTEFAKGALTGIQAAASMPHVKIREAADLKLLDD